MQKAIRDLLSDLEAFRQTRESRGHDLRNDLANIVVRHLAQRGWSQARLAEAAGMKSPMLTRIIHSDANCTFDTAGRLLYALGIEAKLIEVGQDRICGATPQAETNHHGKETIQIFDTDTHGRIIDGPFFSDSGAPRWGQNAQGGATGYVTRLPA
jgi:transcriptional regulator with XRE-family HTH domain